MKHYKVGDIVEVHISDQWLVATVVQVTVYLNKYWYKIAIDEDSILGRAFEFIEGSIFHHTCIRYYFKTESIWQNVLNETIE